MLCQTCEDSFQAAVSALANGLHSDPPKVALHQTPHSLYQSIITGCYICRKIWMCILESKAEAAVYLQRTFEGDMPETYEEFCDQMRVIEGDGEQFHLPRHPTSLIHNTSGNIQQSIELTKTAEPLPDKKPYVSFDVSKATRMFFISIMYMEARTLLFCIFPASAAVPEKQSYRRPPDKVQCPSTAGRPDLWRYWFHKCSTSHTRCRAWEHEQKPFVPDRLIQILTDDKGNITKWRLIENNYGDIDTSTAYVTLSHCWGGYEHLKLTKEKYSAFRKASSTSNLSKTYQDALQIAASLGFDLIWIDSLCIIQDDENDWKSQSSVMGSIYSRARCNIAATWAKDGTDGCFSLRDPCMIDPTTIKLPFENQLVDWDLDLSMPSFEDVELAPLNKRGWVVQERYLTRKQLSFSKRQVYWECLESVASEQYPNGCPEAIFMRKKPTVEVGVKDDFLNLWEGLVVWYSRCTLTRKSDKLIALAGIASELQKATKNEYLAGLWKGNLHKQLCWQSMEFPSTTLSRISVNIAPTWSWVNLDGLVSRSPNSLEDDSSLIPLIQLTNTSLGKYELPDLHNFTLRKLVIRGVAGWARAERAEKGGTHVLKFQATDRHGRMESFAMPDITVYIWWDEQENYRHNDPDRETERGEVLFFMWVTYNPGEHGGTSEGLVLRMLPDSGNEDLFVRMGMFRRVASHTDEDHFGEHIAARLGSPITMDTGIDLNDARLADLIHTVTII